MPARREQRREPAQSRAGTANGLAKLRPVDVALIRALAQHGVRQRMLCAMFEIAPASVSQIVSGNAWRYV